MKLASNTFKTIRRKIFFCFAPTQDISKDIAKILYQKYLVKGYPDLQRVDEVGLQA